MNCKAAALFTLSFAFLMLWLPLHFDAEHFEGLTCTEQVRAQTLLPETLYDAAQVLTDKTFAVKNTMLFPEKPTGDADSAMRDSLDRALSSPYFVSLRALGETVVVRFFIAAAWTVMLLPILLAVIADAVIERKLKYEALAAPHPVLFRVALSAPLYLTGAFAVGLVQPFVTEALPVLIAFVLFLIATHIVISHFHKFN